VDVSVGLSLVESFVVLLLDALYDVLSEVELVLEEVEEALLVEGWDALFYELEVEEVWWFDELVEVEEVEWFDELVEVEVGGLELAPWVGMAPSPLAFHLPQFSLF